MICGHLVLWLEHGLTVVLISPVAFIYRNNPVFLPCSVTLPMSTARIVISAGNLKSMHCNYLFICKIIYCKFYPVTKPARQFRHLQIFSCANIFMFIDHENNKFLKKWIMIMIWNLNYWIAWLNCRTGFATGILSGIMMLNTEKLMLYQIWLAGRFFVANHISHLHLTSL